MPFGFDDSPGFGFSAGRQPSVTEPYMPSPEQVAQAQVEQDKPALFWRALQVPNRLLGGQMVTGFLEGTGRGGIGEGLLQGFLNNPLFQISDGVFGTHITKDVNFADVRKAFGDNDAEGGIANFAINTVGDILTSPLELMWSPFAKIVKATEGASAFAKGTKNFGAAVFKDMVENTPAGLAASVANEASPVRRALFAFKVPFTEKGFAFKAPVNLDLYTAKTIDGMVGWLNSNPATSAVLNLFTRARLAVKDPEQRAIGEAAKGAAEQARRDAQQWFPLLKKVVDDAVKKGLKLDNQDLSTITLLHDIGVTSVDDAAAMMKAIEDGPGVALAKRRTRDLLTRNTPGVASKAERRGVEGIRDMVFESQRKIARDLEIELKSNDPSRVAKAFERWITELPDARLPDSFRANPLSASYESRLRPGVDLAPHEYKPVDVVLSDIEGRPVTSERGIVSPGAQNTSAADRAADILTGEPLPSQVMGQKYQTTAKALLQSIMDDKGIDHLQKLADVGEALRDLSRRIGLGEQAASVLTTTIEQYLPRSLTPEMRKLLGAEITKATQGRVNLESTMMEMNLWAANYGSRLTNYKAVTLNGDNGTMSVMELLSKVIPEDLLKKLKGAGQAGDEAANEAFQFMSTNPFYTMHRRIESHIGMMEKAAFHKAIDESPLILAKTKVGEASKIYENTQQGRVGVVVNKNRMSSPGAAMKHGELVDEVFQVNNRARLMQSRQQLMDYFSDEVERIEKNMRARGEEPTVATVEQAVREHREALIDTKPNDWDPDVDVPNKAPVTQEMKNSKMGQHMTRYVEITVAEDPVKVKGVVYHDPIVGDVNPAIGGTSPARGRVYQSPAEGGGTRSLVDPPNPGDGLVPKQQRSLDSLVADPPPGVAAAGNSGTPTRSMEDILNEAGAGPVDLRSTPATAQVHTQTTTITDDPTRRLRPIEITREYAESAIKQADEGLFREHRTLERSLDDAVGRVQFWGDRLASLDEGVSVHVPMAQQAKGDLRNATRRVGNSTTEETAALQAEQQARMAALKDQSAGRGRRSAAAKEASAKKSLAKQTEQNPEDITKALAEQHQEALKLNARELAKSPKAHRRIEEMIDVLEARLENLRGRIPRAEGEVAKAAEGTAAAGAAKALTESELEQALSELKMAKETFKDASKPLDDIRRMTADNWEAAAKERDSFFRQAMERRMGRQALGTPQLAADRAAGMLEDADAAFLAEVENNPFAKRAVADRWAFDMAGRKSEAERLRLLIDNERQATKETLARFRELVRDITGSLKAAPGERTRLIKDIINRDPHGSEMIDELHILLRQEKNGNMPLQEMEDVFRRRAAAMNERLTPGGKPVDWQELYAKWQAKHTDTEIHWYDPTVHEGLYGRKGMWNQMFEPTSLARTWPVFDKITSWWKAGTVLPPWYLKSRARDVMATQVSASTGLGLLPSLADHASAFKVARTVSAALEGDTTAAQKILIDLGKSGHVSAADIIQAGQRTGAINGTLVRDELGVMGAGIAGVNNAATQEAGFVSKFLSPTESGWAKMGARNMEFLDNHAKIAVAIQYAKQKGVTIEEAFNAIKPWVYDPARADLSNAERYIFKKLIPFYSYQKFAIQSQLKAAFQKPSTLTWWEKAHSNANRMMGMSELEMQSFLPEFIQTNLGIPTEKRPDGLYVKMFGNFLPFAELNRLVSTITQTFDPESTSGIKDFIGGNLNPAIRVPVEWFTNRSFYTQRPIEQFQGQEGEMFGIPMSLQMKNGLSSIRMLNELDQLNVFNFGDVSKLMSLGDAVERRQYAKSSFLEKLGASSFNPYPGGKPYFLSSEMQARVASGKVENEISQLKHQMKVQVERGNESTKDQNLQKLQELMAAKMARLNAIDTAAKKLGLTKDKRGDYHAPVQ